MILMVISGAVAMVFGTMFLFFPKKLVHWSEMTTRQAGQFDPTLLNHRVATGICLLAVGIFCLSSAYYVWLRLQ